MQLDECICALKLASFGRLEGNMIEGIRGYGMSAIEMEREFLKIEK